LPDTSKLKLTDWRLVTIAVATLVPQAFALPEAVLAQSVVQPLPGPEAQRLNAALTRLAHDPRDAAALVDAGEAALALGDFEAAAGFFRRASETQPGSGRAKAGLAGALVLGGDPYSAIPMFEEAAKAGASAHALASERGLAYDLVGANALAQDFYRKALASDRSGEIRRRLALSLAISGDAAAAEKMLLPQLRAQDKSAWRTRAFVLAITGRTKDAVDVTRALLPASLAKNIVPYLRYMPQLTPAQQAAAANLGKFPRASEIGRDDPRIAAYASLARPRAKVAAVDASLVPQGEPLGRGRKRASRRGNGESQSGGESRWKSRANREKRSQHSKRNRRAKEKAEALAQADEPRVAPPEPHPTRQTAAVSQPTLAVAVEKPVASSKLVAPPMPVPAPELVTPAATVRPALTGVPRVQPEKMPAMPAKPSPSLALATSPALARVKRAQTPQDQPVAEAVATPAPVLAAPATGSDLAKLPSGSSSWPSEAASSPSPTVSSRPAADKQPGFSDLFGDLGRPAAQATPSAGAVDIRKIEPAKPKPKKPVTKPASPSHPSRIWVQLGIGQKVAALKYDWRRLNRQQAALYKGRTAYVSDLGQTNRMLTGPFASRKAANAFLARLAKAGFDGPYLWISPAGQVVDQISN
jgi:Flp pilus assembly protein TadD